MRDEAFNKYTLIDCFKNKDFKKYPTLIFQQQEIINRALKVANLGYAPPISLLKVPFKGKVTYRFAKLEEELILRKSNLNIRKKTRVKQRNRDEIVANLIQILREGVPYQVYRLDIKSFYESFCPKSMFEKIKNEKYFDQHTKELVISFFNSYINYGGSGLPRGLAISATLSEYLMGNFDRYILRHPEVSFYARYVDDIIIVTTGNEDKESFIKSLLRKLPDNLRLNKKKQIIQLVPKVKSAKNELSAGINMEFDYLGYKFIIKDPLKIPNQKEGRYFRDVILDIADAKVNKIKFKITKSLMEFHRKGNYSLLKSRIKLLTNNYNVLDRSLGVKINVGIFSSYHRVNSSKSKNLLVLDEFLGKSIFSKGFYIPSKKFSLTIAQKQELVRSSFYQGFVQKSFVYFSPLLQRRIQKCWTYAI